MAEVALLSVEQALEIVLARFAPLEAEQVALTAALDRVLAEDIVATEDLPPFDHAAMDGYAVRGEDLASAPREAALRLQVRGEIAAGAPAGGALLPGTAVRIMTGAPLPAGADTVVPLEQTDGAGQGWVRILAPVPPGRYVRRAGEEVRRGELVLERGLRLRPAEVGLLASLGRPEVAVTRRPRVAILATGDELVEPGRPLAPGQIRSSNAYLLHAQVRQCGGEPILLPPARDRFQELQARFQRGLAKKADLFLTTGGVSGGDYDLVQEVLARRGQVTFSGVRMHPGRRLAFGQIEGVPVLAFPGNPAAALVGFVLLARPAILRMLGRRALRKPEIEAVLLEEAHAHPDRRRYLRAMVEEEGGRFTARLAGLHGTGMPAALVHANALAIIPESAYPAARAGTTVRVLMLDWPEVE